MNIVTHLNINGIQQIVNIKINLKLAIFNLIKSVFSFIKTIKRPIIKTFFLYKFLMDLRFRFWMEISIRILAWVIFNIGVRGDLLIKKNISL